MNGGVNGGVNGGAVAAVLSSLCGNVEVRSSDDIAHDFLLLIMIFLPL